MKNIFNSILPITGILILNLFSSYLCGSQSLDPSIRYGKLKNGFTYYIKPTENSSEKMNMNLIVEAGLNRQKINESEFAHILEHLSFSSGKHISFQKSAKLLDEIGIELGDLNAHVWGDYTGYIAEIDGNNDKAVNVVLTFFKDIMGDLQLTDKDFDMERIAVINESNLSKMDLAGLGFSLENELTGRGSVYPEDYRKHMNAITAQDIRNFYKDWYQPDLMALVVTGNVRDVDKLEDQIHQMFSQNDAGNKNNSKNPLRDYLEKGPQFLKSHIANVNKISENIPVNLNLYYRQEEWGDEDLKSKMVRKLFLNLLEKRYRRQLHSYNSFYSVRTEFLKPPYVMKVDIVANAGLNKEIIIETQRTLNQVKLYGFTSEEFQEGKTELLKTLNQKDTLKPSYWKEEIIRHFVEGEELPPNKIKVLSSIVSELDREGFNEKIKKFLKDQPDDITLAAYTGDPALGYSEGKIRNWFKEANGQNPKPYEAPSTPRYLLSPQKIKTLKNTYVDEKPIGIPGARKFIFKNGVSVILKPSKKEFRNSENKIGIQGYSPIGINCLPQEDYFSALNAPSILLNTGAGALNKFELKRYLDTKDFKGYIQAFTKDNQSGFRGSVSSKNIETALQLIYLYFTEPKFSQEAFEDWKTNTISNNYYEDHTYEEFLTKVKDVLPDKSFVPKGKEFINGLKFTKLPRVKESYERLFNNPGNFTFIFEGDFDQDELLLLCERYLGNLPQVQVIDKEKSCPENSDSTFCAKPTSRIFVSSYDLKAPLVKLVYVKNIHREDFDWKEEIKVEFLRRIMTELLHRKLRSQSEKGGVYSVMARRNLVGNPNYHQIFIDFSCMPEDMDRLIKESKQVVQSLKDSVIDNVFFENIKEGMKARYGQNESELSKMLDYVKNNEPWIKAVEKGSYIDSLTKKDIQNIAREYLKEGPFEFKMVSRE